MIRHNPFIVFFHAAVNICRIGNIHCRRSAGISFFYDAIGIFNVKLIIVSQRDTGPIRSSAYALRSAYSCSIPI